MSQFAVTLTPLIVTLGLYLALQLVLNLFIALSVRREAKPAATLLASTFWAGMLNALFFITASIMLHVLHYAPDYPPQRNYTWLALAGLPLGPLVWWLGVLGRKLGRALFGKGELIAAEDAILRVLPHERYFGWGIANLAILQPLGRELFLRGVFLPSAGESFGWGWAVAATLIVELLLRMNIVWLFQTLAYALCMCGLYLLTHSALTGLIAAMTAGLVQAVVLLRLGAAQIKLPE